MSLERMSQEGSNLGIGKMSQESVEGSEFQPKEGEGMRINRNAANDERYEDTAIAGQRGEIGGIRWKRIYLEMRATCNNGACGNLLGSQYGVVEEGKESGPYYCTPDCLREAKSASL